jgi:amidohydrolase
MSKKNLHEITQDLFDELKELSDYIYDNPELGYEEYKSSQAHIDLLKRHDFTTEQPYAGMETAFRAEYDSGKEGPVIAYLSEYDALPGLGHGCGHNMLGTVNTGAGIALSKVIDEIGGKVVVFGTPAEETDGGKVHMVNEGSFDDIDVAMCTHPNDFNTMSGSSMAIEPLSFEFYGKGSHAAESPFDGLNALDAVINMFNNVNALRQQIHPSARVHGIIKHGGDAPNIIPDYTRADFYVRALDMPYLEELSAKVINSAKGAALAAGVEMKYNNFESIFEDMVTNQELSQTYNENAAAVGVEMLPPDEDLGSLDMGNVSHVVPSIHSYYSITNNKPVNGHTKEFRDATKTDAAYTAMIQTVEILARTGYDVVTKPELLKAIKEEFQKSNATN